MKTKLYLSITAMLVAFSYVGFAPIAHTRQNDILTQGFRRGDSDGDGKLSADELNRIPRLKERLAGADKNKDGVITFDEFRAHLIRANTPPIPAATKGKLGAGDHTRTVTVGDLQRRYLVHVPPKYDAGQPASVAAPVVLVFHGGGGNPESMIRLTGLNGKADTAGFVAVYPYGSGPDPARMLTFNGGNCCGYAKQNAIDEVGFVRALLDDLAKAVNVDPNRVYATGLSNGAIVTYYVASELSDRIAAIAPVGGPMGTDTCQPKRPVPVMHFHGTADELAPFKGGKGKGVGNIPASMRPEFYSVDHSIQNWVKANGCDAEPKVEKLPDLVDDGMTVTRKTWGSGKDGSEVVLIEIEGGGHTWPGMEPPVATLGKSTKDISANDLMWEFFQKHPQKHPMKHPMKPSTKSPATKSPATGNAPGQLKALPDGDATRDAAGAGQLFEAIHVPGFTDFREGLNGFVLADVDRNGYLDILTVTTEPFALDATWADQTGKVKRTRDPKDKLRLLLNHGGLRLEEQVVTLTGSAATPNDLSQGWRGGQVPALADFNGDGWLDLFITRQSPMRAGKIMEGMKPVGCSLFISDGSFHRFRDVSIEYAARNELAYNRQVSLGDVNRDGFIDIALGADNVVNAFEGLPKSALLVFQPKDGKFAGGKFQDIGGTDQTPDFGGFYHDSARDKAGPNLALRDLDNDGDLDLLQSTHVLLVASAPPTMPYSPAEYRHGIFNWRNLLAETGRLQFEKVTGNGFACEARLRYDRAAERLVPMTEARAPALATLVFADVNNDGLLDALAVSGSDPAIRPSTDEVGARFWLNRGGFRFEEATAKSGLGSLNQSYREWQKFFVAEPSAAALALDPAARAIRSQPGLKAKHPLDQRPVYSDAVFADFNNDGWLDLVVLDRLESRAIETRSFLFMNRGDGTFEPEPTTFSGLNGSGISGEAADLNNDGLVDLVIAADPDNTGVASDARRYESMVFMNAGLHDGSGDGRGGGRGNHWLRMRFSGVSDAQLLGARVELREPGGDRLLGMRGIYSNHTYKSGSPLEAHFGLGKTARVDVRVTLPGGRQVAVKNVAANRYLDLNLANGTMSEVAVKQAAATPAVTAAPKVDGKTFTWLREETFTSGGQKHTVRIYRCELFAKALGLAPDATDIACEFVLIPGGSFTMGSSQAEQDAMDQSRVDTRPVFNSRLYSRKGESPQHLVRVPAFLLARAEVTQKLWRGLANLAGLPADPSFFTNAGDRAPVEQVSWDDVQKWMQAINQAHGLALRLPSEAEWEYACRAGTTTPIYNGVMTILGHCNSPELDEIGWYMGNSGVDYEGGVDSSRWVEKQYPHTRAGTHPVGKKKENAFGLHDMIGNVMEWCEDHAHANYNGAPTDGSAWIGGDWIPGSALNGPLSTDDSRKGAAPGAQDVPGRVRRGGSWRQLTYNIRSALRSFRGPSFSDSNHGFRVAAPVPVNPGPKRR